MMEMNLPVASCQKVDFKGEDGRPVTIYRLYFMMEDGGIGRVTSRTPVEPGGMAQLYLTADKNGEFRVRARSVNEGNPGYTAPNYGAPAPGYQGANVGNTAPNYGADTGYSGDNGQWETGANYAQNPQSPANNLRNM